MVTIDFKIFMGWLGGFGDENDVKIGLRAKTRGSSVFNNIWWLEDEYLSKKKKKTKNKLIVIEVLMINN